MKKFLVLLGLLSVSIAGLTGCGSDPSDLTPANPSATNASTGAACSTATTQAACVLIPKPGAATGTNCAWASGSPAICNGGCTNVQPNGTSCSGGCSFEPPTSALPNGSCSGNLTVCTKVVNPNQQSCTNANASCVFTAAGAGTCS